MTFSKRSLLMIIIFVLSFVFSRSAFAHTTTIYEVVEVSKYQRAPRGIWLWVSSGGCSDESQFAFEIQRSQNQLTQVKVLRIKEDFCLRYMPRGQAIFFGYDDVGVAPNENFVLLNPAPNQSSANLFPVIH